MKFVFLFLTYFTIIGSRFIHLIRTSSKAFLLGGWVIIYCLYVPQLLYPFICQWTSRLLPCLAIVNSVAINIGVHVSFSIMVSSGYMPSSGIAELYDSFIPSFFFKGISILFSIVVVSIFIPINSTRRFLFLHTLSSIYCM